MGPGVLVAAGLIGPGTLLYAPMAVIQFGYSASYGLITPIAATVILNKEMRRDWGIGHPKRTGKYHKRGDSQPPGMKILILGLILSANSNGNALNEGGQ